MRQNMIAEGRQAAVRDRSGLTSGEAAARLQRDGYNELAAAERRSWLAVVFTVAREPMFLLLMACGGLYIALGDPEESIALLAAVFLVIGITLYQEQKTERALQALRTLSSPRALVIRDGAIQRVAGREVVRGDLIVLREGDRVPADAVVDSCANLFTDESLLTGESVPVRKVPSGSGDPSPRSGDPSPPPPPLSPVVAAAAAVPGGDDRPFVWSGSLIVRGDGIARVTAIGAETELGKIGKSLASLDVGRTALQREVAQAVRVMAILGLAACLFVGIGYGLNRHQWLDGALAGLTLAISMVPEEFPVILTVFLALGAWRIARRQVLTRRLPAIETLGSATVLCVDKTGTITCNRMSVVALATPDATFTVETGTRTIPSAFAGVLATAILASKPDAFDPMERAFTELDRRLGHAAPADREDLVREYGLSDRLLVMTQVWRRSGASVDYDVAAKGAPEAILRLCHVSKPHREQILRQVEAMANDGLRVLGVARTTWAGAELPDAPDGFTFDYGGLVGLADPVRPGVAAAIDECHAAGIRVVMITGDYPSTALNIARQIGLSHSTVCLTGAQIASTDDESLRRAVLETDVFARMVPEQKLRLVRAFQANHEIVAMTGDGVNDGPALKAANIGIAMGSRGTDVAREAASLVLLDDDFSSIVRAVRLGRRVYDNIQKATVYVLAIHLPIAGIAMIPVLLGWPLVLMPVHVIFIELIVDPACSIAFEMEPEEADVMRRPPRRAAQPLFSRRLVIRSMLQGIGALAVPLTALIIGVMTGRTTLETRATAFTSLIAANLALILSNRSLTRPVWRSGQARNPGIRWLVACALGLLAIILYVPACRELFRLAAPRPGDLGMIVAAGVAALMWMELVKGAVGSTDKSRPTARA